MSLLIKTKHTSTNQYSECWGCSVSLSIVLHTFCESTSELRGTTLCVCPSSPNRFLQLFFHRTNQLKVLFTLKATCFLFMLHQQGDGWKREPWKLYGDKLRVPSSQQAAASCSSMAQRYRGDRQPIFFPCRRSAGHSIMSPVTSEIWPFASEGALSSWRNCLFHQRLDRT